MPIRRTKKYQQVKAAVYRNVRAAVAESAIILQRDMKVTLSQPGRGIKHPGNRYPSSAPGDPPAVQTGHLRRSVQVDLSRLNEANPRARVGTNIPYGAELEFGTRKVAPRPWARPSARKARPKILNLFRLRRLIGNIK